MRTSLIRQENEQYHISSGLLLLFSTPFIIWQMGIVYFSGTTLSLWGRTPIPLTQADTTLVIAAGYIASMLAIGCFPRQAVRMQRCLLPIAFVATALMLLPVSAALVTALFNIAAFACVFSIGTMLATAAPHLTVDSTWRDGILSMTVGGSVVALLQSDFLQLSFTAFTILSLLLIAMQTAFYFLLPARIEAVFVGQNNPRKAPRILFCGLWLLNACVTLLLCFASSFAESVPQGVSALYAGAALTAIVLQVLRRRFGVRSLRLYGGCLALAVFGFVLAFLSLQTAGLQIIACLLLGIVAALAGLWIYFAAVAFRAYSTRFIGVIGAGMGLVLALAHAGLLDLLRQNTPLLYGIYAALSVAMLLIYYFLEPYFAYAWQQQGATPAPAAETQRQEPLPQTAEPSGPLTTLSEQERTLARLILAGHTETSAAQMMNITLNTQKSYRKNLYAKLDIHSKRELFAIVGKGDGGAET